jgi:Na+-driven multidrug efflux pump
MSSYVDSTALKPCAKFLLNLWFVRGGDGLPEFGGPGTALATFVTTWLSAIACITVMSRHPAFLATALVPPARDACARHSDGAVKLD